MANAGPDRIWIVAEAKSRLSMQSIYQRAVYSAPHALRPRVSVNSEGIHTP